MSKHSYAGSTKLPESEVASACDDNDSDMETQTSSEEKQVHVLEPETHCSEGQANQESHSQARKHDRGGGAELDQGGRSWLLGMPSGWHRAMRLV